MTAFSFGRASMLVLLVLLAMLAGGCATVSDSKVDVHLVTPPAAQPVSPPAAASTGAIFNAANHRPLFEDRRARMVGDTLTVQIEETLTASQQSTTKLDRSNSLKAGVASFPFASAKTLGRLSLDANSAVAADTDGKTDSANTFSGSITVLVQQVLPNGNLLVAGEKQIGVNQNVDVMRFSGVVNPDTIRAGNLVSSTQVAEARLEQRGRGDVGRLQGLSWLARFFLTIAPI